LLSDYGDYSLSITKFFDLHSLVVLKARFESEGMFSDNLNENEFVKIGGLKSIRGFNEDQFSAQNYYLSSLELRFIPNRDYTFLLFTDIAKYSDNIKTYNLMGIGLGAEFNTSAGVFNINYALGNSEKESFSFSEAKVHFGYVIKF